MLRNLQRVDGRAKAREEADPGSGPSYLAVVSIHFDGLNLQGSGAETRILYEQREFERYHGRADRASLSFELHCIRYGGMNVYSTR